MKFKYYTTEGTLYISRDNGSSWSSQVRINGQVPEETHHPSWKKVKGNKIESITVNGGRSYTNRRFQLKDPSVESPSIPLTLSEEEACILKEGYEYFIGTDSKYYPYRDLYTFEQDLLPPEQVPLGSWESEHLGEISTIESDKFSTMKLNVLKDDVWTHKGCNVLDLSSIVKYEDFELFMTPSLMLHTRPCSLTSKQTYNIIRNYVKENINPKEARVTSDYDFCFTVKKVVHTKPWIKSTEILKTNGKSYKKPKFSKEEISSELVEVFEMTHDEREYGNYTTISGFTGSNLKDLEQNIKQYLDKLMQTLNTPVKKCEHCSGTGAIITPFETHQKEKGENNDN